MDYHGLIDLLEKRKSVRRYKPDPVPQEMIEGILEATRHAPSAGNSQPWELVVIQSADTKREISRCIALRIREEVKTDPTIARGIAVQPFLYTAPVLIVVCGDPRLQESYPAWMDRSALLRQSLSNCIYTIQLAASSFGLATAWATVQSGQTELIVKEILGIPDVYTVDHLVPLGYPDHEAEDEQSVLRTAKERAGLRRDLSDVVHYDRYDMKKFRTDEEVKEYIWSRTVTRVREEHDR